MRGWEALAEVGAGLLISWLLQIALPTPRRLGRLDLINRLTQARFACISAGDEWKTFLPEPWMASVTSAPNISFCCLVNFFQASLLPLWAWRLPARRLGEGKLISCRRNKETYIGHCILSVLKSFSLFCRSAFFPWTDSLYCLHNAFSSLTCTVFA